MYDEDIDMEHYKQMIMGGCSLEDILMDWASKDPIGAEWFTESNSHIGVPLTLDYEAVAFAILDMDPLDILFMGARSAGMFDENTEYYEHDEDRGILRALTDEEIEERFTDNFRVCVLDDIVAGRMDPPDEIAEVVELWRRNSKAFRPEHGPYQGRKAMPSGRFRR